MFAGMEHISGLEPVRETPERLTMLISTGEQVLRCYQSGRVIFTLTTKRMMLQHVADGAARVLSVPINTLAGVEMVFDSGGKHSGIGVIDCTGKKLDLEFVDIQDRSDLYKTIYDAMVA